MKLFGVTESCDILREKKEENSCEEEYNIFGFTSDLCKF
jgi:hypothetical protein